MVQKFDLAIVGGSFAGLAAARTAALRGLKVAVIDSKAEPGARLRTTGIVVKEASDDFDLPANLMRKVRGVKLYAPDNRSVEMSAPGYFFQTTDTAGVLRWMAQEAERAGATLLYGRKFTQAMEYERGVALPELALHARYLIGADGAKSRVAEHFGLSQNTRFLAGMEIECEPLGIDHRFLHCFADGRIAPGYIAWVVPGVSGTQIGVAARRPVKPDLHALLERVRGLCDLKDIRVVERRSGLIPTGGVLRNIGRGRVMLIGDAAGMVSPVTGGGIYTALHFGRRAAQLVSDWLCDLGPHPVALLKREAPQFRLKRLMRAALDLAPPNMLINAMLMTAPARALAQRLYFHARAGDGDNFAAWREAFERGDLEPKREEARGPTLRVI
ncbi:MAG TPA: NAD(P)/FAD-dependent oxidoreductase [Rhizomicrobium sp.]|jgi:geranylgeranyl reductase family protein